MHCAAANTEILVLNVRMSFFGQVMDDLGAILTLVKTKTGKVFVPIAISHSPVAPTEKFILVLRTSENVQAFSLQGWFTDNIPVLAKKFVRKTIKVDTELKGDNVGNKLTLRLKQFLSQENLSLVGGFQDTSNNLHLLFFKLDKKPAKEP